MSGLAYFLIVVGALVLLPMNPWLGTIAIIIGVLVYLSGTDDD